MRTLTATFALTLFAGCFAPAAAAAPSSFADGLCPEATQYVLGVGKLSKSDPPQRIYDAVQAAVDAYQRCSKVKLANGQTDQMHYADTRAASFAVVAAQTLVALNRPEDARRELQQWRPLAQQVVDWRSGAVLGVQGHAPNPLAEVQDDVASSTRGDHRTSRYRDSAKEIVAAIDVELARIDAALREQPRPQGREAPAPAPTTHP